MTKTIPWAMALFLVACGGGATPEAKEPTPEPTQAKQAEPPPKEEASGADVSEAEAALKAGDFQRAKAAAEATLAKDPKNAKALFYAGVASENLGDRDGAEKRYRAALAAQADFPDAAINLTLLLLDEKKNDDALATIKPVAAKMPDDPMVQSAYANALGATGDHAGAAAAYEKVVKKGDAKPEVRLGYAEELAAAGKKDDATKALKDALAAAGDQREVLAAYGRMLAKLGDYDDAIKALDRAIKLKASADLYTYRALFKRSTKDLAGAQADLEAATKEDAKFAPAWVYLGDVLEAEKKPADAKKAWQKAVDVGGDSPLVQKAKEKLAGKGGKKGSKK